MNVKIFRIYESIIFIIKEQIYSFCENKKDDREDYLRYIKSIIYKLKEINSHYQLFSKEILTLQNLYPILKAFEKIEKNNIEDLFQIFKCLENERNYINNNIIEEIIKGLQNIRDILIKNFGENSDEYASLFIYILLNQYKIYQNNEHRKIIIDTVCENNNLIKKSIPILKNIIDFIEPEEKENENSIDYFMFFFNKNPEDENSNILEQIDEVENNTLNHTLLYLFEINCENYFLKLKKQYNNDDFNNKILDENSFAFLCLKKCIKTFISIEQNEINSDN